MTTNVVVVESPAKAKTINKYLGGGYTVILPLYVFELGYGLTNKLDLAFRYETISGLFHYPQLAVRWAFAEVGPWTFGARLGANYSLFAIKSAQPDLTSTIYASGEAIVSRSVTRSTDVVTGFRTDFDLWELRLAPSAMPPAEVAAEVAQADAVVAMVRRQAQRYLP